MFQVEYVEHQDICFLMSFIPSPVVAITKKKFVEKDAKSEELYWFGKNNTEKPSELFMWPK